MDSNYRTVVITEGGNLDNLEFHILDVPVEIDLQDEYKDYKHALSIGHPWLSFVSWLFSKGAELNEIEEFHCY